jgi:hypothetical protein
MVNNAFAANLPRTSSRTLPDGTVVSQCRISGTRLHVFSAWKRAAGFLSCGHQTITHIGADLYGRMGTERPGAEVAHLPAMSDERVAAVTAWYAARCADAYAAIDAAFPEIAGAGIRVAGTIELSSEGN